MLTLSRRPIVGADSVDLILEDGRTIRVIVSEVDRNHVRLTFDAPQTVAIWRTEIAPERKESDAK